MRKLLEVFPVRDVGDETSPEYIQGSGKNIDFVLRMPTESSKATRIETKTRKCEPALE